MSRVLRTALRILLHGLRLVGAALFVWLFPIGLVLVVGGIGGEETLDWLDEEAPALFVWSLFASGVAGFLVARRLFSRREDLVRWTPESEVRRLRALGLLVEEEFRVTRAFEVAQPGSGSGQLVCELEDGSSLLLCAHEFDVAEYEGWLRPRRRFPCTRFVLRSCARPRWLIEVECLGEPIEPEATAPALQGDEALDHDLFLREVERRERPYEELRHALLHGRPLPPVDD